MDMQACIGFETGLDFASRHMRLCSKLERPENLQAEYNPRLGVRNPTDLV